MKNQTGSWNKSLLQQIKRLAVVRLNSFWIPLNKMVDNGIWSYHFLKKYGVVPKSVYPESVASSNSRELNQYLNKLLRQDAQILRDLIAGGADQAAVQAKKEELLQEIFNYLAMTLGLPPRQF